jgi:hypothetical protein
MRACLALVLAASMLGCGPQQRSPASDGWSDELADPTGQMRRKTEVVGPSAPEPEPAPLTSAPPAKPTQLGVRHDVMIAPTAPHEPTCTCLAVVVGAPEDPRLSWQNERPRVGEDAVVVALSARGVACHGLPEDAPRRPSIAGVERDGANVVITVEELPPGRPLATGAVVPRPGPGGAVFIRPSGPRVPYARPSSAGGGDRCKVR